MGGTATTSGVPRSAPRWETVVTLSGRGAQAQTPQFTILADAIQWRVRWTCEGSGSFVLTTTPPPTVRPGPIADSACPGRGDAFAIHTGSIRLGVQAAGAWTAVVDQQVDFPVNEPLIAGMSDRTVASTGTFYNIEKLGRGRVELHTLADGRRFVRFEDFETAENTDLFVWLTDARRPANSAEAEAAGRFVLGNLKSTLGTQNYEVPASVPANLLQSIVIWCQPVAVAYTAASLSR